jgi:hypothetical protein
MPLERVEVAERRRPEDRRPEAQVRAGEDSVVILAARLEPLDQLGERVDPQTRGEMVVEGRERRAEQDAVVGPTWIRRSEPTPGDLEVKPSGRRIIERRREPPWRTGGPVPLADVGDLHAPSLARGFLYGEVPNPATHPANSSYEVASSSAALECRPRAALGNKSAPPLGAPVEYASGILAGFRPPVRTA